MKTLRLCIVSILILTLFLAEGEVFAQAVPQYQLSIQNRTMIGTTYQFDIFIKRVGSTNFRLGNSQFILTFNTAAFTSPAITRVAASEQIGSGFFFDQVIAGNELEISLGGNGSYETAADIDASIGTRVSTYQITGATSTDPLVSLTWVNLPNLIRTGASEINASENYRDITDGTGASHLTTYAITASAGANGNVSPPGVTIVNANGSQTYAITPNLGYHVDVLLVDGVPVTPATSYPFTNVVADHSISATFALNTINVTVTSTPPGLSVTVDGNTFISPHTAQWLAGTTHTITTTTPQSGTTGTQYVWQNWSDAGIMTHTINPLVDSTLTANFQTQYLLVLSSSPPAGGSVAATPAAPGGWYNGGASVNINAYPATGYQLTTWTGSGTGSYTGTNNPATITMNGPITENGLFGLIPVHVTVQTNPAGLSFTVDGTPYTSTQVFTWGYGTAHTISTTTPQSGSPGTQYVWNNWSDAGALSHTITPTSDGTLTALFTTQYYLTMVAGGDGTVLPATGWYQAGQVVTISATPGSGKSFSGWNGSGTGSYSGTNTPVDITMNGPITETASFTNTPTAVTVQSNPVGLAITVDGVTYTTTQNFTWDYNSVHTIAVTSPQIPAPGTRYVWNNWSDAGAISHNVTILGAATFTANFTTQYLLTLVGGTGGTIGATPASGDGYYDNGTNVQLSAMPGTGYSFTSWKGSGTGSYTGTNNPAAITMSSPVFDTAQFTLRTYTITVTQGPNGTVAPGSLIVNFGTDQTFVFTPALGYRVDSVIVDGAKLPTSTTSYTFTNVIANHTLRVTFAINLFTIVAVTDGNGTISPSGLISMGYGGNQEFDFTPATGYHVDSILVDGVSQPVAPSYTFVNVISDHSIRVTFARNQYTITSSAGVNGSISPLGAQTLHYGDSMEFTFVPDDRYQVDSVIIDGTNVGPSPSFKFTNVTASHTIRVTFAVAQAYQTMYRTFTYDELPVKRSIKKRPYDDYWEFTIKNTWNTPVIQINLFFSYPVWQLISSGGLLPSGSNRVWTFRGTLNPGDSVVLKGRCAKIIHQKIIKLWFDPSFGTPVLKNVLPTKEIWEYPMPNVANVRETAFIQAKTTTGFVVGIPRPDSIRKYGWVRIWNSPMMYRSMFSRGLHIGTPRGFDMFSNNTPFTREQRGLIPSRQNNRLFADLLALKFNIWVSDLGITMSGLGDLRFVESGNPYTQLLVRQIAARADSLMTFHVSDPLRYRKLDSTVQQINASFSGPFDTTCWSTQPGVGIICKGARSLFSVPFLQAGGATPEQIPLFAGQPTVPLGFELSQNYPNPFNPTTTIDFMLPSTSIVALRVYNVLGQEVNVLVNGETMEAGLQEVEFNGNNLSSGVYFYRLTAEYQDQNGSLRRESLVRKMMLMK